MQPLGSVVFLVILPTTPSLGNLFISIFSSKKLLGDTKSTYPSWFSLASSIILVSNSSIKSILSSA